jgi:hypothetical protein
MSDNGIPMVVPPMGVRTPMGGAMGQPLGVQTAPPQQQFAPVPPVQPTQPTQTVPMPTAAPPWAAQPQVQVSPIDPQMEGYVVQALRQNAAAAEILHYFPQVVLEQLRAVAQKHGLVLNEGLPQVQQPVQPTQTAPALLPPIAAAQAPQAQTSAELGAAEAEKVAQAQRVTKKKHWPLIKQALLADRNATAEQIAAAIHAPVEGIRKAMGEILREIDTEAQFPQAAQSPMQGDAPLDMSQNPSPVAAPPYIQRLLAIAVDLETLARARGYTYLELEAASAALGTVIASTR